jgi:peroxiredoxin
MPRLPALRFFLAACALAQLPAALAQTLSGTAHPGLHGGGTIVLFETRGAEQLKADSAKVSAKGRFKFSERQRPEGFYQLAFGDTDRVDIILSPRDAEVVIGFGGAPLQEHITVHKSLENQRLWEYKWLSRATQAKVAAIREQRKELALSDTAGSRLLTEREAGAETERKAGLDRIIAQDPDGYFARVVQADRRLMEAVPKGYGAIGKAFAWADQGLMRSSIYPKAVMAYLQAIPFDTPGGLRAGCDSILSWAAPDSACWRFARSLLVRVFHEYGPDDVAQYMVDQYVTGSGARSPAEPELLRLVGLRMLTTIGATAPNVLLPDPVKGDTTTLHQLLPQSRFTLLFFYSSTCDHCHQEMPGLRSVHDDHQRSDLAIVGIALDADREEFQETLRERALPWASFSELNGWGSSAAKQFAVKATPTMILLDAKGTIVAKPYDHIELREVVDHLLQ